MKLSVLIARLKQIQDEIPFSDPTVNVMIETVGEGACQYEFPANDVAFLRPGQYNPDGYVVIMHEKWDGSETSPSAPSA